MDNVENYATIAEAFASLVDYTNGEGWTVTPEVEEGEIVYRLAGQDITSGMASIG